MTVTKQIIEIKQKARGIEKKSKKSIFVQEVKIDYRKAPKMSNLVLNLTEELLFEAKLNKKFLQEGFN